MILGYEGLTDKNFCAKLAEIGSFDIVYPPSRNARVLNEQARALLYHRPREPCQAPI